MDSGPISTRKLFYPFTPMHVVAIGFILFLALRFVLANIIKFHQVLEIADTVIGKNVVVSCTGLSHFSSVVPSFSQSN
jgi:hypothetical protein